MNFLTIEVVENVGPINIMWDVNIHPSPVPVQYQTNLLFESTKSPKLSTKIFLVVTKLYWMSAYTWLNCRKSESYKVLRSGACSQQQPQNITPRIIPYNEKYNKVIYLEWNWSPPLFVIVLESDTRATVSSFNYHCCNESHELISFHHVSSQLNSFQLRLMLLLGVHHPPNVFFMC